jgi:hypothetical protein
VHIYIFQADAVYLNSKILPAGSQWKITFAKGSLPPVRAFWSFSAYDTEGYFVHNRLGRYALHDWDPLQLGADGSLTLYFGDKDPAAAAAAAGGGGAGVPESNWLPAPAGSAFDLTVRMYWPEAAAINRTWTLPPLQPV